MDKISYAVDSKIKDTILKVYLLLPLSIINVI